ncbi:MAG: hypothetical protein KAS30_03525, partial [Candidatus Diapherotrites archaeon]|nr:hypothetical protein [Candidatus Diapherotrites archaeon]
STGININNPKTIEQSNETGIPNETDKPDLLDKPTSTDDPDLPEQPDKLNTNNYINNEYGFSLNLPEGWNKATLPENAQNEIIVLFTLSGNEIPASLNVVIQSQPEFESLKIEDISPLIETQVSYVFSNSDYQKESSKHIILNENNAFELTYSFFDSGTSTTIKQTLLALISGDLYYSFTFASSEVDFESNKNDFESITDSIKI